VPDKHPSIRTTRSPDSTSFRCVSRIGSPAPTVASYRSRRPCAAITFVSLCASSRGPERGRLLASTRSKPEAAAFSRRGPVASAVTSTRIGRDRACRESAAIASAAEAFVP
jgi:hypothetical protein